MKIKAKIILSLVASFSLGLVCGLLISNLYHKPAPFMKHQDFMKSIREKLELTDEQQMKIDSILYKSKITIDEHKKAIFNAIDTAKIEIDKVLTEKQKKTLEQLIRESPPPRKN